ncbi:DUF4294 domain-containing protein [Tenacibaculum sp. IB213877]|uniref:DUF4294 domain-containing protein n=1 Tax=Tenacibaculum sp. IB213877 TaxID=3097351 RepID=UPI002A599482|nr:DUF4294 domain-containing protein [Tenacibaculum sp. IB213877]MDY0781572.1 DUF4294 domain-containing protein [Tenacibaculum sp. IB213877]
MKKLLYIVFILFSTMSFAQIKDSLPDFSDDYYLVKEGDTLMIQLKEVTVLPKHKFKSHTDANYYYWFRKKVFKAYPYAVLASQRLDSLNLRLSRIDDNSKKRQYVRRVQKYVEDELSEQIKKMTRTEGRILIKLIHRQTGKTAFDNIKNLRSGWKAFWYNTTANIFKLSLKEEYNPDYINEDYLIEDILQRAFIDQHLQSQEPKLQFDAFEIIANQRGNVDVEEYKKMFSKMKKKKNRRAKKKI